MEKLHYGSYWTWYVYFKISRDMIFNYKVLENDLNTNYV